MKQTAVPRTTTVAAGGVAAGSVPNNTAGYGRYPRRPHSGRSRGPSHPPTVSLSSPAAGATFTAPATILIEAGASDTDGTVVRVELFAGPVKIATLTQEPFVFSWKGVGAGTYALSAVALDDRGASTTSGPRVVFVSPGVTLPSPWAEGDVGTVALPGSASFASGVFTISGAGLGIGGTADQFHFVYQRVTGNGEVVARVIGVEEVGTTSKAGVMIRESLAANSRFSSMLVAGGNRWMFLRRLTAMGGSATSSSDSRRRRAGSSSCATAAP